MLWDRHDGKGAFHQKESESFSEWWRSQAQGLIQRLPASDSKLRCHLGPVFEGDFLLISLIAGDLAADVGCPFVLHNEALLVAISVYVGNVLPSY